MTIDKAQLKALAETGAANGNWLECPATDVLALLAEIESLHAQHGRDSGELRKLCSARDSARRQRDQLKAENEALRKDALRYRWLRDKQTFIWLIQDWFPSDAAFTDVDGEISAAMAKEASHG